jgi:hypothetical protein
MRLRAKCAKIAMYHGGASVENHNAAGIARTGQRYLSAHAGAVAALFTIAVFLFAGESKAQTVRVDATPSHAVNSFSPPYALGSTVDRIPSNATDAFFKPEAIKEILSAGWGAISYRQNTELFVQAWHWNPKGKWSDPAGKGYFTGDSNPTEAIRHSYGYALQHRGFTRNGGTEDTGFSRLNDGDTNTYWKSNPYLTKTFTGEDDALHPQWVVIDLEAKQSVNAIRIDWAESGRNSNPEWSRTARGARSLCTSTPQRWEPGSCACS